VFHGTQNHQSQKDGNQELFANWILARLPHSFDYAKDEGQGIDSQNCGQSHGEVPVPRMRAIEAADVVKDVVLEELVRGHYQLTMPVGIDGDSESSNK